MVDGVTYLSLALGFGFILVAGARLGAGSHTALGGLFPSRPVVDWPTGVQEADAPRFDIAHLDALGHGMTLEPPIRPTAEATARAMAEATADGLASLEVVELYERRLDPDEFERPRRRPRG
jgi:hypothetical protein